MGTPNKTLVPKRLVFASRGWQITRERASSAYANQHSSVSEELLKKYSPSEEGDEDVSKIAFIVRNLMYSIVFPDTSISNTPIHINTATGVRN